MRIWTIAFALGIFCTLHLPELPGCYSYLLAVPALWLNRNSRLFPVAGFIFGALWCLLRADLILSTHLDESIAGKDVYVTGRISGIPELTSIATRFVFDIETMTDAIGTGLPSPGKVRLSWYRNTPELIPDDRWRFRVRLKPPHGFSNPGGFDYELWMFQNRIRATGYIRNDHFNRRVSSGSFLNIHRIRYRLVEAITRRLQGHEHTGMIVALATGSRHLLDNDSWQVLQRTGTGHLLAISGLHIGIIAALFFFIGRWLWSVSGRLALRWPAQDAGLVLSLAAAGFYAALAGFTVPTQRALVMLLVAVLTGLSRNRVPFSWVFAVAMLAVLLIDPTALLMPGFWLSFSAIAIILYGMTGRIDVRGLWWRWGRVQCLVALGLLPILLFWFQGASLVGIPANLVAIPVVSLIVVPVILIAVICLLLQLPGVECLLQFAEWCLQWLWIFLTSLSDINFAWWQQGGLDVTTLIMAVIGVLIICLPRGMPARWLGCLWLLPVFFPHHDRPGSGQVWFTLLDVGQGMAAVVRTREHVLVYDTGARYSDRFNAGAAVLLPYLREEGIGKVDRLMISHGDNDHIGGADALLSGIAVTEILSSVPERFAPRPARHCLAGEIWYWDSVRFEIMHPDSADSFTGNNASCVVRISRGKDSILLTGDIEQAAEHRIVDRYGPNLKSSIISVPHHGSKTSSSGDFIDIVGSQLALVTAGYRNRYGFPKQAIMSRYRKRRIRIMNTARQGAITINLTGNGFRAMGHRKNERRFWYSRDN